VDRAFRRPGRSRGIRAKEVGGEGVNKVDEEGGEERVVGGEDEVDKDGNKGGRVRREEGEGKGLTVV